MQAAYLHNRPSSFNTKSIEPLWSLLIDDEAKLNIISTFWVYTDSFK